LAMGAPRWEVLLGEPLVTVGNLGVCYWDQTIKIVNLVYESSPDP
jgi:hypothetical protein